MSSLSKITEQISLIKEAEQKKASLMLSLKDYKFKHFNEYLKNFELKGIKESQLAFKVKKACLNERIAGIDSGFIGKNLYSFDLILIRAVSVIFDFKENILSKATYYPNYYSLPEIHLSNNALLTDEFNYSQSIKRLLEELKTAIHTIKEFKPKYCFLDGSIIPQYAEKPRSDSKLSTAYHDLINKFQELYSIAEENSCTLIACVEDSRGSRFNEILIEGFSSSFPLVESLQDSFDITSLDYLLNEGERTFAFPYTKNLKEHAILKDFSKEFAEKIHAFYLKPVKWDKPLRIEFLAENNLTQKANEIASIVFALSSMHKEYAYPSILIEADLRARLKPEEINLVYDKLVDKLGKNYRLLLRRELRPF